VRSDGLTDTMSRYLIRRIEETPNITVLPLKLSISMARSTWVCELAERADWQDDKEEHCSPGRDDGSCSEHHVASRLCRVGWGRIHQDRLRSFHGRAECLEVATRAPTVLARDQCPWACSPPVTCAAGTSSVLRRRWAKVQSRFPWSIKFCATKLRPTIASSPFPVVRQNSGRPLILAAVALLWR